MRYCLILILPFIFVGCTSSVPTTKTSLPSINSTEIKDINHQEELVVHGNINPKLKVTLEANFKATNTQNGCFIRNSGWTSFVVVPVEDSSAGKDTYRLSVPINWEHSLGSDRCEYELYGISLHVKYPDKTSSNSSTDIILGQNNDDAFRINGQKYYDKDRDYKVRYLTDLSILYCMVDENRTSNNFICTSNIDVSGITKSDSLPPKLSYNVNIFIRDDQ